MDSDDASLIQPGPAGRLAVLLGLVGLAVLLATGLVDALFPAPKIRVIGVERTEMRELKRLRKVEDGSYAKWIENELRMRSRVRRTLAPYWVAALFLHADVGDEDVIVGDDHWLFLRTRAQIEPKLAAAAPVTTAHTVAAIARRFAVHGAALHALPIPRKAAASQGMLPDGFQASAEVDGEIADAMRATGVSVIDVDAAWAPLAHDERYLPYDTHWTQAAQESLAAEVARTLPATDDGPPKTLEPFEAPNEAGLLSYLGLDPTSPALAQLEIGDAQRVRLAAPPANGGPGATVALVGTSFTATFDFHAFLTAAIGRDVQDVATAAAAFSDPLVRLIVARTGKDGQIALPEHVVFEFPMHQVITLPRFQRGPSLVLGQLFLRTHHESFVALGTPQSRRNFAAHELPSTGDGALAITYELRATETARWRYETSGIRLAWKQKAGTQRVTLPVVDGIRGCTGARLVPLDDGAKAAQITAQIGVEAHAQHVVAFDRAARASVPIGRLASLLVRFTPTKEPVEVTVRGRSAAGQNEQRRHRFENAGAGFCVLSIGALAGGELVDVQVNGAADARIDVVSLPTR